TIRLFPAFAVFPTKPTSRTGKNGFNGVRASTDHRSRPMTESDLIVLDFLATHAGFTSGQIGHLRSWWESARDADEPLGQFLKRQQLLSESTIQVFAQMGGRHLTEALGAVLVDHKELQTLRRRLPDVVLGCDGNLSATVTLLSGDDTAKDATPPPDSPATQPAPPRVGQWLGKYLLADRIGEGGAGLVFRTFHPSLQIPVAVKVLRPS